jgi:branched-chain amino acid transport system substrate-binding protein
MMHSSRRRCALALAAAIPCLLLGACSDDDTTTADGPSNTPTTGAKTPTGEPLLLGAIAEGENATPSSTNLSVVLDATEAAAEAINADGGIDGRPIEIVECDTAGDPNQAAECGRKMVDEGVVALVGAFSAFSQGFLPVTEEAGIPSIGHFPLGEADLTATLTFPLIVGAPGLVVGQGVLAGELDVQKPAIVRNEGDAVAQAVALANIGLAKSGLSAVNEVTIPLQAPDMSSFVAAATRDNADAIIAITTDQDLVNFVRALRQSGSELPVIAVNNNITRAIDLGFVEDLEGVYGVSFMLPATETDNETVARYVKELDDHNPDATKDELSENAWASVQLFAEVARGLDQISSKTLVDQLQTLEDYDPGLLPTLSFTTPQTTMPGLRIFTTAVVFTQVEGGELKAVDGEFVDVFSTEPAAG